MVTYESSAAIIQFSQATPPAPPPKPATFNGDLTNLPIALRSRTQEKRWVNWKWVWIPDRQQWTKPPYQPANPSLKAKSNDPKTWGPYHEAVAAVLAGRADGIGYMLAGSDLNAADLDDCYTADTGEVDGWARTEIAFANSYTEVTPSGTGLRILGVGSGGELHRQFKIPGTNNRRSDRGVPRHQSLYLHHRIAARHRRRAE